MIKLCKSVQLNDENVTGFVLTTSTNGVEEEGTVSSSVYLQ